MKKNRIRKSVINLMAGFGATSWATAQAPEPAAPPPPTRDEEVVFLGRLEVTTVPLEEQVLPTARPFGSVYGLDLSVLETPRSATVVTAAQLQAVGLRDPSDFARLTSSSYTDAAFGNPNVPRFRGEFADLFYNGARNSFTVNGNGAPVSFNSVEAVNIIKGPSSVVQGAGAGVGGVIDLVTKVPRFDRFQGSVSVEAASYDEYRWSLDFGGPISDKAAYRVSYAGEESEGFYLNRSFDQHSLFAAVRFLVSPTTTWDINTEVVHTDYTENVGINRVNQGLIDNGTYLTGAPVRSQISSFFISPYNPASGFPVGNPPSSPYSPVTGILTISDFNGTAKISRNRHLSAIPGDGGTSVFARAQSIVTSDMDANSRFTNTTSFFFEHRDKLGSYYYAQSLDNNFSIENIATYKRDFEMGSRPTTMIGGLSTRFTHVYGVTNFNNEPASVYDLTDDPNLWRFDPASQFGAFPYRGTSGRILYGVPGRDGVNGGDTNDSDLLSLGVFLQQKIDITDRLTGLWGARLDAIKAWMQDPLGGPGLYNGLQQSKTSGLHGLPNLNASLVYAIAPTVSVYGTYSYVQTHGTGVNGGVFSIGKREADYFHRANQLLEIGVKSSLLENKLFTSLSLFQQERIIPSGAAGQSDNKALIRGIELEGTYQPNRNFSVTAGYSYVNTEVTLSSLGGQFYNFPAEPGEFIDAAGLFARFAPGQTFSRPGIPEHQFNILATYQFENGFGASAGVLVTGPIQTTYEGQLDTTDFFYTRAVPASIQANGGYYRSPRIPWQYTVDASVFYRAERYTARISVRNLTDEKNWIAANPFYGNDFIVPAKPLTIEGSLSYRF
jgi:outer membrane receptor protein involved in Fe transport